MAKTKVDFVKYPEMPKDKSQIDEKYIMEYVKNNDKMDWLKEKLEAYKDVENATSQFTSLRADFWADFIKPNLPKAASKSYSKKKTKFEELQDFLAKNGDNQ